MVVPKFVSDPSMPVQPGYQEAHEIYNEMQQFFAQKAMSVQNGEVVVIKVTMMLLKPGNKNPGDASCFSTTWRSTGVLVTFPPSIPLILTLESSSLTSSLLYIHFFSPFPTCSAASSHLLGVLTLSDLLPCWTWCLHTGPLQDLPPLHLKLCSHRYTLGVPEKNSQSLKRMLYMLLAAM
jgi:hypothetical protein